MISLEPAIPAEALGWRNDPSIYRWCRQHTPITEMEHADWLKKIHVDPTIKMFSVYWDTSEIMTNAAHAINVFEVGYVGVCGLTSIDRHNRNAEFSLYIAPEEQGNGYATPALKALCKYGFNTLGLKRIWGEVFDGNPAIEMFQKAGFRTEGTLRSSYWRDGKWIDSFRIGLLAEEFNP